MELLPLHKEFCVYFNYEKNRTARTIDTYAWNLKEFVRYLEGKGVKAEITALKDYRNLRGFMYSLLDRGLNKKTVRQRMLGLKSFCKYLLREGYLESNPFDRFDIPRKERSVPRPLPDSVKDQLLNGVKKRFEKTRNWRDLQAVVIMELGCKAGLRKGAMRNMRWEDTDLAEGYTYVVDKGQRKKRYVLVQSVVHWLKQLKFASGASSGPVLLSPRSRTPISMTSLHDEFKRYVRIAGLKEEEISLHKLRHTYGTYLHRRGLDIVDIQEAMGHEDISSTLGYVQVGQQLKEKIIHAFSNEKK